MKHDKDKKDYLHWLKLAKEGNPVAQLNVGVHFEKGVGVKRNYRQALFWIKKAVKKELMWAEFKLGQFYQLGRVDGKPNYKEAKRWYESASEKGDHLATRYLANMYLKGLGVDQDKDKFKWLMDKADQLKEDLPI